MKTQIKAILLIMLSLSIAQSAAAKTDMPDWLKGKLFISSLGSDILDWDNPFEWKKYVRIYDFKNETQYTLEVPRDSYLTRDLGGEKKPIIISHATRNYSEHYGWESDGRWKEFSIASYYDALDSESPSYFSYGVSENVTYSLNGFHYFYQYGEGMAFDAPVQILDIKSPAYCVYYLEYCVSDDSALQIQFVCENDEEKVVYDRYPLDYQWGNWAYAISPNGCAAYKDANSNQIAVHTGNHRIYIPETENTRLLAWRNDRELLLFTRKDTKENKYYLVIYDVDENTSEFVLNSSGKPICIENAYLYDMDMNQELDCLAFCYVNNPDGDGYRDGNTTVILETVSLSDGMQHTWNLYPIEKFHTEEEQTLTNDTVQVKKKRAYSISDDGIYFFEPSDDLSLELAWYSNE